MRLALLASLLAAMLLGIAGHPARAQEGDPERAAPADSRAASAAAEDWTGEWQTYWRDGQALMAIHVTPEGRLSGTFEPGTGTIEGRLDGRLLRGRWQQGTAAGGLLFALAEDGQTFTGRFDNGEYWNGRRASDGERRGRGFTAAYSPRETLRTVVVAANDASYARNAAAYRFIQPLLAYEGEDGTARELSRRRDLLWTLIDQATFRIYEAPATVDGEEAGFEIGPAGTDWRYTLRFRRGDDDRWQIVVPEAEDLETAIDAMLEALGHDTLPSLVRDRADSPRGTMRRFIEGANSWDEGGAAMAMATLDTRLLPAHLRDIEGPILADYLKQILDRVGFVIWQEIPNDPNRLEPFVHYDHPLGRIAIEQVDEPSAGAPRWQFSADSLASAPHLFDAVQDMPTATGIGPGEPLTDFFRTREIIRDAVPALTRRDLLLENWQWIALAASLGGALLVAWAAGRALAMGAERLAPDRPGAGRGFVWPARLFVLGAVMLTVFAYLGIAQSGLGEVSRAVAVLTAIGLTALLYRIASAVGSAAMRRAEDKPGFVDEIVASLATGLVKLVIVVGGIVLSADIVGLPYEGVITGLGVGGIALAFAARDTVSNMLGGAILMTDRPFKRGDLVETDGTFATVEDVGLRSTRMRTLDDALMVIPNAQLSDKAIINWGKRRRRKVMLTIGLTYDTPRASLDRFVERLREVYAAQPRTDSAECYVGIKSFGASSIDIELWGYLSVYGYDAQVRARHELIGDIIELAREIGVSFAFPTRTVHVTPAAGEAGRDEDRAAPPAASALHAG